MNICFVSSEVAPLAKTGGLADVASALAGYLHKQGHKIRVVMPKYSSIDTSGFHVQRIAELSDLELALGEHPINFSIDRIELPQGGVPVYLVDCPKLYQRESLYTNDPDEHLRFTLLSRATLEMCQRQQFSPDIVHCNDWQTGLIPLYLKTTYAWDQLFAQTRSLLTIHNIGYQGTFSSSVLPDLDLPGSEGQLHQRDLGNGVINLLKTGVMHADLITTVSPTYAREIMTSEYGMGLEALLQERKQSLVGVLNGVDYAEWNPESDPLIPANFSAADLGGKKRCKTALLEEFGLTTDPDRPLIGLVSRLAGQKGIDLIESVLPRFMSANDVGFVALGSGEDGYESFFSWLQNTFPGRAGFYRGFNEKLAHWIEAGSDMFLMPSNYEPCGLNQMYSLKYGTVPIVRETGGLADSVQQINSDAGTGTGILFEHYNDDGLMWALNRAMDLYADKPVWSNVIQNGMAQNFSWDAQGAHYERLYRRLAG